MSIIKTSYRSTFPFSGDGALTPLTDKSNVLEIDRDYDRRLGLGYYQDHVGIPTNDSGDPQYRILNLFEGEINNDYGKKIVVVLNDGKSIIYQNKNETQVIKDLSEKNIGYRYITTIRARFENNLIKESQYDKNLVSLVSDILPSCFKIQCLSKNKKSEIGSCFYVKNNYLITCGHVISREKENKNNISSFIIEGSKKYPAKIIDVDYDLDVAILYCDTPQHTPIQIKSINSIKVGSEILCVGSPYGYDNNVSKGILSSKDRFIESEENTYFFMDLSVFPGSSGGPVIDISDGKVFGIASIIIESVGVYGLNAGIPIDFIYKRFFKILGERK